MKEAGDAVGAAVVAAALAEEGDGFRRRGRLQGEGGEEISGISSESAMPS